MTPLRTLANSMATYTLFVVALHSVFYHKPVTPKCTILLINQLRMDLSAARPWGSQRPKSSHPFMKNTYYGVEKAMVAMAENP